jgi:selenocysteine-specific elongation factor
MLVVGTAGHIDHGKSALIKALTGIDPDRLKEEQARGITIDLGFAHADIDGRAVSFVDVPGHERFVRHMLAGAGGIEAVLFVVAATESVKPQTREHFEICRLLGIDRGVIALTKCDIADERAIARAEVDVRALVGGSALDGAPVVRVSSRTGEGLDALRCALAALPPERGRAGRPGLVRLPVDRAFTLKGFGTVVTGTLVSGRIATGDTLTAFPDRGEVRVRGLQVHGRTVSEVSSPSRAAVNLTGVDVAAVPRGTTLGTAGALVVTRRLDVRLHLIDGARALQHGARVRVHHGTSETLARVAVAAVRASRQSEWTATRPGDRDVSVGAAGEAYARLRLERAAAFTRGDRLVLRAFSPLETIGGAAVLDPDPPTAGVRRADAFERFRALESLDGAIALWIRRAGARGLPVAELVARGGLDPDRAAAWITAATDQQRAIRAADRLFDAHLGADIARAIETLLATAHRDAPHEAGVRREALRAAAASDAPSALFDVVIDRLRDAHVVTGADRLALASHRPRQTDAAARIDAAVLDAFEKARLAPPDMAELAGVLHVATDAVEAAARRLVTGRRLVRIQTHYFHDAALQQLKTDLREWVKPGDRNGLDVAAFKTRYGLTRKFAIPLLEWLDRERITRRVGDRRVVL